VIALLLFAAAFVPATGHQCRVPPEAYQVDWTLNRREIRAMEHFSACLCGPDGSVDFDARPHRRGGYFMHPSCNRDGWDGHHYVKESKP
jgi:hypothetical protein